MKNHPILTIFTGLFVFGLIRTARYGMRRRLISKVLVVLFVLGLFNNAFNGDGHSQATVPPSDVAQIDSTGDMSQLDSTASSSGCEYGTGASRPDFPTAAFGAPETVEAFRARVGIVDGTICTYP